MRETAVVTGTRRDSCTTGKFWLRSLGDPRRAPGCWRGDRSFAWRSQEGAELLELSLLLPVLLVMVIGIMDFGRAYNLQQKLADAAREGARIGASQTRSDLDGSNPVSVQTIKDDVTKYLVQAGVDTSFIGSTMSYNPAAPCTATYYTTSGSRNFGLMIERCIPSVDANGTSLLETRVTLTYPYDWAFGFDHIIKFLIPSATVASEIILGTDAIMVDLV